MTASYIECSSCLGFSKARPVEYTRDPQHHRRELAARGIFRNEVVSHDDGLTTQSHSTLDSPFLGPSNGGGEGGEGAEAKSGAETNGRSTSEASKTNPKRLRQEDDDEDEDEDENESPPKIKSVKLEKDVSFPNTRGNSPDLPFEQVGSPDDSDSSDNSRPASPNKKGMASKVEASRSISPGKPLSATGSVFLPQQQQQQQQQQHSSLHGLPSAATPPPSALHLSSSSASSAVPVSIHPSSSTSTTSLSIAGPAAPTPPDWLTKACHTLRLRFPLDRFEVLIRPRPVGSIPPSSPEWRIRCQDCPGKLYTPGPAESLTNFEIHLKNRAHRAAVQKAVQTEVRKPYGGPH